MRLKWNWIPERSDFMYYIVREAEQALKKLVNNFEDEYSLVDSDSSISSFYH